VKNIFCQGYLLSNFYIPERLVSRRTGTINQIRAFLLERGVAVRQGLRFLRAELPRILAVPTMCCRPA
jgi:transposase